MLRVANARYPLLEIDVYDVLVQGESAAFSIANAIKSADTKGYDIIVIGRGGGSIEDLWAFNEEIVADAIFSAKTPIVSAVGHEIDWVISDFVADLRAPTPSAAMEMILPDRNELYMSLDGLSEQLYQQIWQKLQSKKQELEHLKHSYIQHSVEKRVEQQRETIRQLRERFEQAVEFKITSKTKELQNIKERFPQAIDAVVNLAQNQLIHLQKMLESNHPKFKIKRGFAQISRNNQVIDIEQLEVGESFEAQSERVVIEAKVLNKRKI
jgi:exodeoxyribonuclease VII large subunit